MLRHVLGWIGRALITVGVLILLFVAYQLWGTGIYTARAQNRLESQFERTLAAADGQATTTTAPTTTTPSTPTSTASDLPTVATPPSTTRSTASSTPSTTTPVPPPPSAPPGDGVARIAIPSISLDWVVVEGTDESDLRQGPGHYPATPFPGQAGNSAIAGHRTTYGAPFGELDAVTTGDVIQVTTVQGSFEYRVYEKLVVAPTDYHVLDDDPSRPAVLTLTTCHPKYSAAQRLVVKAAIVLPPSASPYPSSVDPADPAVRRAQLSDALSGDSDSKLPTVIAGLILAVIGALWWLAFHRHPRWTTWFLGVLPFAVALAVFYYLLERALPGNY